MNPAAVGGEFYLWELAKGLSRRGHQVTLLCSSFNGSQPTEVIDGVELVRVNGSWNLPLKIFAEYLKRAQASFDVVVEEAIGGQRLPFFGTLYVKESLIAVWHQRHTKIFCEQYPLLIAAFLSLFEQFLALLYRNRLILTPSEGAKQKLLPLGFKKSKIQVIYDGVGATFDKVETNSIRDNTVVCLGKMRRYKRIDHAILALPHIISKVNKPCRLVIAGKVSEIDKGYVHWLHQLVENLGISKYVEFRLNISEAQKLELLRHAKVLVQPSPIEGFSIVVAEANRCGTPVVASDGVPADVLCDGYNGFSYHFGQLEDLSNRIVELLNDGTLWHIMSRNASDWSKQFTWERSALELEEILKKIKRENNRESMFSSGCKQKPKGGGRKELKQAQKNYFDSAAIQCRSNAVLVPGASRFRNIVIDKAMKKTLMPILKRFQNLTILEVGCGVGRWTKIISEKNIVVGVDVSKFMIALAKERCKDNSCSFVVADVSYLPFVENAFDIVISITVLQHLLEEKELLRALKGIANCCKSKAFIVEEMWSSQETLLDQVYCPIRIVPLRTYVKLLLNVNLRPNQFSGITPAILAVNLTRFLASKPSVVRGNLTLKFKSSKLLSEVIHFIMGVGTLSSVIAPKGNHNPCFSLHTMLIAEKFHEGKGLNIHE